MALSSMSLPQGSAWGVDRSTCQVSSPGLGSALRVVSCMPRLGTSPGIPSTVPPGCVPKLFLGSLPRTFWFPGSPIFLSGEEPPLSTVAPRLSLTLEEQRGGALTTDSCCWLLLPPPAVTVAPHRIAPGLGCATVEEKEQGVGVHLLQELWGAPFHSSSWVFPAVCPTIAALWAVGLLSLGRPTHRRGELTTWWCFEFRVLPKSACCCLPSGIPK